MLPQDIPKCVELIASHPILGPRYGNTIPELHAAWLRLAGSESKRSLVFEEVDGARVRMWGVGFTVFVANDLLRELKSPPLGWFGPELAQRIAGGEPLVLSDRELRDANSDGGVTLLLWEACTRPEDALRPELLNHMVSALIEVHRGFYWKELMVGQVESGERLRMMLKMGALLWNPAEGEYIDGAWEDAEAVVRTPHVLGISREARPESLMSWLGTLFDYHAPQFGFSRGEQRLLALALAGETDEELSSRLGISLSGVKKMWLSIYGRMAGCLPETAPDHLTEKRWIVQARGKEKKRHLLAYLHRHPEELCPISRRTAWRRAISVAATEALWS